MKELPKSYSHIECEAKWSQHWDEQKVYAADLSGPRSERFVVDTPPPTVSGSLHVGHVFSYTHTDLITRYQRMRGKQIFYPMGWDDNGLATERRVQNKLGIRCNPSLPYNPEWKPKQAPEGMKAQDAEQISRQNFIEACALVTAEDEVAFENLWRHLALSLDWKQNYATIDSHCRKISQLSFLDLVEKKLLYTAESPTMWDVDFQTALAQADLEDRNRPAAMHQIRFGIEGGGEITIATTRPELIAADFAICAHPDDPRYKHLFGKRAISPLFRAPLIIEPSTAVDPEKGSGIMQISTFGDAADVDYWKRARVPARIIVGKDGRILPIKFGEAPFESLDPEYANKNFSQLIGLPVERARKKMIELLAQENSGPFDGTTGTVSEAKPLEHPVKFYEKGERPIEFITTRQWFVRILDFKKELVEQGEKIEWHPSYMRSRYTNWVQGLAHDWCISRQRFFGVPFPVWYKLDAAGVADYSQPIYATPEMLPVDPLADVPPGYQAEQRDKPNGFSGDPDVMDTWATSSLTPQLMSHWKLDEARHQKLFPMDIRPQSHEIIRTWAFYTIAKAWMHENEIPWKNVIISGWILDPDRKKMSKSKGNTITPGHLLEQFSADGVRYWAARARLGVDTAFDEKVFKIGQKLSTKLFNAAKFVLMQIQSGQAGGKVTEPLDLSMLAYLRDTVARATDCFERFDYAQALQESEECFWFFCDNYLELAKGRSYETSLGGAHASAVTTLDQCLRTFLRLFAPIMPYVTEEIWSWRYSENGSSVHRASWPSASEFAGLDLALGRGPLDIAAKALSAVYAAKTAQQKSLGAPLRAMTVRGQQSELDVLNLSTGDIKRAGKLLAGEIQFTTSEDSEMKAELVFEEAIA